MNFYFRKALLLTLLFSASLLHAQQRPEEFKIDWTHAGCNNKAAAGIPVVSIPKSKAGTDISGSIMAAITNLNGKRAIIYIPAGKYYIKSSITLSDSVIMRGAGSDSTQLLITLGNTELQGIGVLGHPKNSFVPLNKGLKKGAQAIKTGILPIVQPGDYIQVREKNGAWDTNPASWAEKVVGQIVKVTKLSKDSVYFDQPLRIGFDTSMAPEIRVVQLVKGVGIEAMKISRVEDSDEGGGYNIYFSYAAGCWVKGVESDRSEGSHILAQYSTHIQVTGCYIHDAYHYDGVSTGGYGVTFINHTGDCLVQDNIFKTLRHAMVVKQGANGNVFGYNYSIDTKRTEFPSNGSGDISLHGHYPFANLFEGNIIQTIHIDQAWGPSGPDNTFLRNRTELYGILMSSGKVNSDRQCFVGNEVTGTGLFLGNYSLTGSGHYTYANNVQGELEPASVTSLKDNSYYLSAQPAFWNINDNWPSIGLPNAVSSGGNPAMERYLKGKTMTVFFAIPTADFNDSFNCSTASVIFEDASSLPEDKLVSWKWYFGDGSTSAERNPAHSYSQPGWYQVSLVTVSDKGMYDSATRFVYQAPPADAAFTPEKKTANTFHFKAEGKDTVFRYHWDFGDGSTSDKAEPDHTFLKGGSYKVSLTVTNGHCEDYMDQKLTIKESTGIEEEQDAFNFSIYPNPVLDHLSISMQGMPDHSARLSIFDTEGRLILADAFKTSASGNSEKTLDFSYPAGIYLLRLECGTQVYYKKIFKY